MKRILLFCVLVFVMGNVFATSPIRDDPAGPEGVSPGSYQVDFVAGLEKEFAFSYVLDGEEDIKVRGDLSEYVELDRGSVSGGESVVVRLKLPEFLLESPEMGWKFGVNNIWIIVGDVASIIKVNVPYPDRYVDLILNVPDVNVGEEVSFNLKVVNMGREVLSVIPVVEIYYSPRDDPAGPGDELIETFEGEGVLLDVSKDKSYKFSLQTDNFSQGEYRAIARSGEFFVEDFFRLGGLNLRILNYTTEVRGGGVRRFEIDVESLSDDRIKEVYAEVRVIGRQGEDGVILSRDVGFDTSIVSLDGWERKTLVGYFDTEGIEGEVMLSVDVKYDGKVESEVVGMEVIPEFGLWVWIGGIFGLILFSFLGWKFFRKGK